MIPTFFTITAQTNLHVGSGDANYGIIDKLVQRDILSQLPTIHASSLKGGILQHFLAQDPITITDAYIDTVFGGQNSKKRRDKTDRDGGKSGEFVFMQAQLASIPVRCKEHTYMRATSCGILRELAALLKLATNMEAVAQLMETIANAAMLSALVFEEQYAGHLHLEDLKRAAKTSKSDKPEFQKVKQLLGGDRIVVLPDEDLKQLTDNHHLPVIARNNLENGQSTNLWYEQVLPRQTRFLCTVLKPTEQGVATEFDKYLTQKGHVQIGANASVGYGYCQFENL